MLYCESALCCVRTEGVDVEVVPCDVTWVYVVLGGEGTVWGWCVAGVVL